jgi:hypothetical protein
MGTWMPVTNLLYRQKTDSLFSRLISKLLETIQCN